jgi:hypothetical protein
MYLYVQVVSTENMGRIGDKQLAERKVLMFQCQSAEYISAQLREQFYTDALSG